MVALIEMLIGKGIELAIYDPEVSRAQLIGSNRAYIEREIPHIWSLTKASVDEVLRACDTVVIGNASGEFRAAQARIRPGQTVVDLVRAFTGVPDGATYIGLCW
jgi:GDP-mannose 6-dehydrogenase